MAVEPADPEFFSPPNGLLGGSTIGLMLALSHTDLHAVGKSFHARGRA